ncbi:hypothetical protein L484_006662 [Morus notabilis]|uniref:Uncharacterized protein n=1 Tax=Morus notabilis TaxID=981085 RepID=W9S2C2_9ROSA|nr:hypothetical protein L484_006662 [Morus notabilis]
MGSGAKARDEEQDGMSAHSPCKAPPSSASSLPKEQSQVELELRLLQALEIYPPVKLQGSYLCTGIHRHFVLFGLMEFLRRRFVPFVFISRLHNLEQTIKLLLHTRAFAVFGFSFDRQFSADEVLQLLDRFYNLEVLKPDDEDTEILNHEEDFSLPQSFFVKEES